MTAWNVYLKLFFVLHEARPATAAEVLRAWARLWPPDAADLDRIVRAALGGQALPDAPEIWLANGALTTGTSLFDQYRTLPRPHTFDVNAAVPIDWRSVPGVTAEAADRLVAGAPYASLEGLLASPALSAEARTRVAEMATAMLQVLDPVAREEGRLSLSALALAYLWRVAMVLLVATVVGAALARAAGVRRPWAAILVAAGASLIVITLAWLVTSPAWYPVVAPVILGGAPWAAWRLRRGRGAGPAATALATWLLAALPALLLTHSW